MIGHQAAIEGHCKVTESERRNIISAILKQKVGVKAKSAKAIEDARKMHDEGNQIEPLSIVIKKA